MLIIAVIVSVTIGITKAKLDNVLSYTYYNAYSTLREITRKMLADWDPTDPEYKQQALNSNDELLSQTKLALHDTFINSVLEFSNDRRFFSILISHIPFSMKFPIDNKVKAGNQITLYGCPARGEYKIGSIVTSSGSTTYRYHIANKKCLSTHDDLLINRPRSMKLCPGTFNGVPTYDVVSAACSHDCVNLAYDPAYANKGCGQESLTYNLSCSDSYVLNNYYITLAGPKVVSNGAILGKYNVISKTLIEGNLCKLVIECAPGYEWKEDVYTGSSPSGFKSGKCVLYGEGACNGKKCYSSGQKLDPDTCKCYVDCWDGSRKEYSYQCPSKVTCWDGSYAHNKSECPACTNKPATIPCGQSWDDEDCKLTGYKKTCLSSSAPNLNPTTCVCYANCWDGTTANYSWNCPTKYTCWDGSFVHNTSECPPCTKTCSSGYRLNTTTCECEKIQYTCWNGTIVDSLSDCPPKIPCWDGSYVTNASLCPSYVTCWDGSKKYNWSQCPACPNKPRCPAGNWSDITCTGDSKMCPAGQHLNSGCSCVNDCPSAAELTPCRLCSDETGEITKNPDINRTCSDETYEWSEEQCKCIISPRTLPRQGANFCKLFEANANIMGNTDVCQGSAIAANTTDFSDKKPDVTLRNGLRIYNMHNDATAIAMLAGNTQGGVYDGVPNTNAYGYTVYIDIDGVKGDSRLWSDVYPFYITLSGKVIPGYDATANPSGSGADSKSHMQVSVEYENYNSGKRAITWLAKSVPFKEGACLSGYVGDATPYCRNNPSVTKAPNCTAESDSVCRVKQIQPVKFFF